MFRHFIRVVTLCAWPLAFLPALAAAAHATPRPQAEQGTIPSRPSFSESAHCRSGKAIVADAARTGQLRAAYAYDDARNGHHALFLVFADWTGALLKRNREGLYCRAQIIDRDQTLALVMEVEAAIGGKR